MRVVLFGATGRTGRLVLARLAAAGHEVVAYGRRAPEGWAGAAVTGAVEDRAAVAAVLAGADASVSCLGSTRRVRACLPATEGVIAAAPAGFPYVVIGGAAVDAPGDAKGLADRLVSGINRLVAGPDDRRAAGRACGTRGLAPRLALPAPALPHRRAGDGAVPAELRPARRDGIDRAELAAAAVAVLTDPAMARRAPFVARGA